jgi:WD40 repeat protein
MRWYIVCFYLLIFFSFSSASDLLRVGQVKLFRYPALAGATPAIYTGHSAHVTSVRFSADERYVVTTGGFDNAVMQWTVV